MTQPIDTVAITEIIWTVVGFIGLCFTSWNLWSAMRDWKALEIAGKNGLLKVSAKRAIIGELLRLAKHSTIITVGVVALTLPPIVTGREVNAINLTVTIGFITIAVLLMVASVNERIGRVKMMHVLDAREP